jgi:hypothetical protein
MPEEWNEADQDDSPKIDVEPERQLVGVNYLYSKVATRYGSSLDQGIESHA